MPKRGRPSSLNFKPMPGGTPEHAQAIKPLPPSGKNRRGGRSQPKIPQETKDFVYKRDNYRCVKCGSTEELTIDHKQPWSKGGGNRPHNLQLLCGPCNRAKADQEERSDESRRGADRRARQRELRQQRQRGERGIKSMADVERWLKSA